MMPRGISGTGSPLLKPQITISPMVNTEVLNNPKCSHDVCSMGQAKCVPSLEDSDSDSVAKQYGPLLVC